MHSKDVIVGQDYPGRFPYQEGSGENTTIGEVGSFRQLNETFVLFSDSTHGCIRSVDRVTNKTERVAGVCREKTWEKSATPDGEVLNATFSKITDFVYYNGLIYATENYETRIRKIDIANNIVTTIATKDNFHNYQSPRQIVVDPRENCLYVTSYRGIYRVDLETDKVFSLTRAEGINKEDGPLANSTWSGIGAITFLADDTLMVADSSTLRVIDLQSMNVSTWCFTYYDHDKNCSYIRVPRALLLNGHTAYIAIDDTIATLELPNWYHIPSDEGFRVSDYYNANLIGGKDNFLKKIS